MTKTELDIRVSEIQNDTAISQTERAEKIDALKAKFRNEPKNIAERTMRMKYPGPAKRG